MDAIVKDYSPSLMSIAIEANVAARLQSFGRSSIGQFCDEGDLVRYATGIPMPLFNGVIAAKLAPDRADIRVQETLAWFSARRLPMIWCVGPSSMPRDLGEHLSAQGLAPGGPPGRAVDLHALNDGLPTPKGLVVRRISDQDMLRTWVHTTSIGFDLSPAVEQGLYEMLSSIGLELPTRLYLGLLDGEPVATSKLFLAAGVAGIYWVATIPEARRRGIGTAITLAPLRDAREMGYRIGVLEAFEAGRNVYERIGFREGCHVVRYQWVPQADSSQQRK